ncbi:MAG: DUF3455 domain-containing protein [Pyrinomonadaceae bacterium]
MNIINLKQIIRLAVLLGVAGFALTPFQAARIAGFTWTPFQSVRAAEDIRGPELPSYCSNLEVPSRSKVIFHVYALGVQIYRWNGSGWEFVAPLANLYADSNYHGQVGTHYAGPTWESNSGSKVIASRLDGCSADPTAVPWLLLETVTADGPGIFKKVDYIQRVNTVGGISPANPGSTVGEEVRVPYTAEYYFYRAGD